MILKPCVASYPLFYSNEIGGFTAMKPVYKISLLAMVALLLAACTATPLQEPTPTPISVPTILPTPSSIVSIEERLLAIIDIKYPDELAFIQGFIWVKTDDGHVVQVDPATNSVVSDIKVDTTSDPYHYCQGLGTDGENIWACSASGARRSACRSRGWPQRMRR